MWIRNPARLALAEEAIQAAFRLRPDAGEAHLARAENLYRGYLDYSGALGNWKSLVRPCPTIARIFELKGYIERRRPEAIKKRRYAISSVRSISIRATFSCTADRPQLRLSRPLRRRSSRPRPHVGYPAGRRAETKAARGRGPGLESRYPPFAPINGLKFARKIVSDQSVASGWLECALAERDSAAAADALAALGENTLGSTIPRYSARFVEGLIARMTKDDDKARGAFTAARAEQEKLVRPNPMMRPAIWVLGLIDAGLGRKEEAFREGGGRSSCFPWKKIGPTARASLRTWLMIAAWVGDNDLACEHLAAAIHYPGPLNYGELKLEP